MRCQLRLESSQGYTKACGSLGRPRTVIALRSLPVAVQSEKGSWISLVSLDSVWLGSWVGRSYGCLRMFTPRMGLPFHLRSSLAARLGLVPHFVAFVAAVRTLGRA